jgi:hypothetical protein
MQSMKKCRILATALVLALTACGGGEPVLTASNGGGVGSGGTGITNGGGVGYVVGFGSIFVNGVHYDISQAVVTLDDATSLQLGMTVKVTGNSNADFSSGTATRVDSAAEMRGEVSAVNAAGGTFDVQGTQVSVDSETVFDGLADLSFLNTSDWVQVYGLPVSSGLLRATRVEKLSTPALPIVSGTVSNLNTLSSEFSLGGLTIDYTSAAFTGGLTVSQLANGMNLRVRAAASPVAAVLLASAIQVWNPAPTSSGAAINMAGVITDYSAAARTFHLLGRPVDASSAIITGGASSALADGIKVEVAGMMAGGVLNARKLRIRHIPGAPGGGGAAAFNVLGVVGSFVSPANFKVQGQAVDASAAAFVGGSNLANGVRVAIVGSRVVNGVLIANTVTFNP